MTASTTRTIEVGNIRIGGASHLLHVGTSETGTGERYEYFLNIIRRLVSCHGMTGRRWFITYDGKHDIDDLGEDCVVFVYGDERSLTPWRYEKAGLILKAYGIHPHAVERFRPDVPWMLDRVRIARNALQNLAIVRRMGRARHRRLAARTLPIPLGYARQIELPIKPLHERPHLLWFAGSLHNAQVSGFSFYARLANMPKFHARQQMVAALRRIQQDQPAWPVSLRINQVYQSGTATPGHEYSERIMDTKICVVPRGTTPETHRLFEAMRAGCIVIAQDLPDFWFYRSAPVIQIRNWDQLEGEVQALLDTPARMESLHRASRRWWEEVAGPAAMTETIAALLKGETTVAEVAARR
jgi:hypothetical protein